MFAFACQCIVCLHCRTANRSVTQIWIRDGETTIKIKFSLLKGAGRRGLGGRQENRPKHCFFRGKRHDNKILNLKILLSKKFVVIVQAPNFRETPSTITIMNCTSWWTSGWTSRCGIHYGYRAFFPFKKGRQALRWTSRCSSRCPSRCAIHYGYRAWAFPYNFLGRHACRTNLPPKNF